MKRTMMPLLAVVAVLVALAGFSPGLRNHLANAQTTASQQTTPGGGPTATAAATATPTATESPGRIAGDIIEAATAAGQFNTFIRAVQAAGLTDTLRTGGPYTVFAPTDAAFSKIPQNQLQALLANSEQLRQLLLHHVVQGEVGSAQLQTLSEVVSLQGSILVISPSDGVLKVSNATVVRPDIQASNGVIHGIDTVLQLPAATPTATSTATPTATATASPTGSPTP